MSNKSNTEAFVPTVDGDIVEAYRQSDRSGKARIRTELTKAMQDAIRGLDMVGAANAQATIDALGPAKAESAPVDFRALVASRVATLRLAADMIESGKVTPDGVPSDIDLSGLVDVAGEASDELAAKLASARVTRRTGTDSHDTRAIIDHAFEQVDSGTFLSIAQIRSIGHDKACCDTYKGDGAIAAYMFPNGSPRDDIDGVQVVNMTAERPRGGVKA